MSSDIGETCEQLIDVPSWFLVICLCFITALFTEITSNTATVTIFLPVLAAMVCDIIIGAYIDILL